ncbi:hypothetical protein ST37_08205 [Vibrio sp. qd031]|nr:hypothetical protein ST37_08205 [Vibrio sp. qd031]
MKVLRALSNTQYFIHKTKKNRSTLHNRNRFLFDCEFWFIDDHKLHRKKSANNLALPSGDTLTENAHV